MGNEIKFQIGKIRCLQKSNVHFWTHCNDIFGKKSTIPKQKDYIRITVKKFKAKLEIQKNRRIFNFDFFFQLRLQFLWRRSGTIRPNLRDPIRLLKDGKVQLLLQ